MKFRLIRSKKAVSPIVATMFLTAIIIAAIGLALGIVFPQINQLNDNIEMVDTASSIQGMDQDIKELLVNGEGAVITRKMELGSTGVIKADTAPYTNLYLMRSINGGALTLLSSPYFIEHNRFVVTQKLSDEGSVNRNSYAYLSGPAEQGQFFVNETDKADIPWAIMNQSRGNTQYYNTSLSYRGLIIPTKTVDSLNGVIYLTISLHLIEFQFPSNPNNIYNPTLKMDYSSLNVTETPYIQISNLVPDDIKVYLQFSTYLEGITTTELAYYHEVPQDGYLNIRLQFITHQITLSY